MREVMSGTQKPASPERGLGRYRIGWPGFTGDGKRGQGEIARNILQRLNFKRP